MKIETDLRDLIFKKCKIKPLEDFEGTITSLTISYKGAELQVRYYFNGVQNTNWFYDSEIEL